MQIITLIFTFSSLMFQYMIYREFILVRFQKTLQIYAIDFETLLMTSNNFALEEKTKNTEH